MNWILEYRYEKSTDNCINSFNFYTDDKNRKKKVGRNYAYFHNAHYGIDKKLMESSCYAYTKRSDFMGKVKEVAKLLNSRNLKSNQNGRDSMNELMIQLREKYPEVMI